MKYFFYLLCLTCSDEDYSGTDRNRPEFNQLLEDAQNRKFNIVLCKTQSRFSRDLEIIEKYIHHLFLEWNIRFISVVDNADTEVKGNKKARQINGLINEWFLEDLSDNIRATLRHKKEKGEFTGPFAPYGYKKSPTDKNQLIIDEPAAKIAREIFNRFLVGESYGKIAADLNARGIPNPLHYKWENGHKLHCPTQKAMCHLWSRNTIRVMLRNEVYAGTLLQGKAQNISYKNSKKRVVDKNKWIRVENSHEPIVTADVWQKVQEKLQSRARCQKYDGCVHVFSQKVFCGECNNSFHKNITNGYEYLRCKTINMDRNFCSNHRRIRFDELSRIVLDELNKLIEKYKDEEYLKSNILMKSDTNNAISVLKEERQSLYFQKDKYEQYFKELYQDKLNGVISSDEFLSLNKNFKNDIDNLEKRIKCINDKIISYDQNQNNDEYISSLVKKYNHLNTLTRPIVDEFIERINIGAVNQETKTRKVEIIWTI